MRWPAPWTRTYVQLRSWWTMPACSPASSNHGVEGRREKPCTPPKVVFCAQRRACQSEGIGYKNYPYLYDD